MTKVVKLPATSTMTVEMCLDHAKARELTECIVCGYDLDGDLVVYSSRMDRQNALWLVEAAKDWVRDK